MTTRRPLGHGVEHQAVADVEQHRPGRTAAELAAATAAVPPAPAPTPAPAWPTGRRPLAVHRLNDEPATEDQAPSAD